MNDDDLSNLIHTEASRYTASTRLRSALFAQIALAAATQPDPERAKPPAKAPVAATTGLRGGHAGASASSGRRFGWWSASIGFSLGVAMTLAALLVVPVARPPGSTANITRALDAELVADHVQSLQVGPLTQVISTDRHTVKPWFQGKLDYAPPVLDLAQEGFPLAGGRVEHVQGKAVAALVYRHRLHVLNLYVWPSNTPYTTQKSQYQGFTVMHWSDGNMQCWLVTDMDDAEVARFGQAWRAQRGRI